MWVTLQNVPGRSGEVRAKLIDFSEDGLGIELPFMLRQDETILVRGIPGQPSPADKVKARVVRCTPVSEGYRAGLAYEEPRHNDNYSPADDAVVDYYDVLQVNTKAEPEVIHRVYRILAQRYHPDNTETGNTGIFRAVAEAYKVLSDPEQRAAYDVKYQARRTLRWQIFDHAEAAVGAAAESAKRRGILELLYTARRCQPAQPAVTLHELEDMLGCPREHLEFGLWYLRENGLITRSDNARFAITAKGVDYTESKVPIEPKAARLLHAAPEIAS